MLHQVDLTFSFLWLTLPILFWPCTTFLSFLQFFLLNVIAAGWSEMPTWWQRPDDERTERDERARKRDVCPSDSRWLRLRNTEVSCIFRGSVSYFVTSSHWGGWLVKKVVNWQEMPNNRDKMKKKFWKLPWGGEAVIDGTVGARYSRCGGKGGA